LVLNSIKLLIIYFLGHDFIIEFLNLSLSFLAEIFTLSHKFNCFGHMFADLAFFYGFFLLILFYKRCFSLVIHIFLSICIFIWLNCFRSVAIFHCLNFK
jgi:hypothetical protein